MLAVQLRSGLAETYHEGAAAVVDETGVVSRTGDIDQPFFLRSSAKPFQALVSQEAGAGLTPLELAMACASHRGHPVHVALVASILEQAGLGDDALRCPPDWPLSPAAMRLVARGGATEPRRIWHNCSGKHAGFLRACVAQGWPVETYLDPGHPLQRRVMATVGELGEFDVEPVGVDGCGAPVLRTTVRAMATMFSRLASDPRLSEVLTAMHRYPALIGVNGSADTEIAIAANAAAKGGAVGCIGVAWAGRLGIAVKSWDGNGTVAGQSAALILDRMGGLTETARERLGPVLDPEVLGGGVPQGRLEPRLQMETG
ncbi:MAG TPA: asparaginase [Acidimicrobiia bacterium]|nr:asparaginase [Acidimicrobiia bacterium]